MKVLYFHQHFSTPKGTVGIRSYEMARRLISRGHEVTMVCGSYGGGQTGVDCPFTNGRRRGLVEGIDVIEFDLAYANSDSFRKRALSFIRFAYRSVGIAMFEKYDLVFATTTPLTAGIPGIFARWLRAKPFVFEVRDLWPELPKAMGVIRNPMILFLMSILEWSSYRSAHRIIGLSPGIVEGVVRQGVSKDRVAMIPNGCDLEIFSASVKSWRPCGVTAGHLLAVFAGTHGVANRLQSVLDAAEVLKHKGRDDIRLVLIGQGKLKPKLQQMAVERKLNNIVFLDPVDKERLSGLMASADLGLQVLANVPAFYYGTSPNKFFDYIASGLPVLNNYPGWLADMILREDCGFVVAPDDPTAFANALEEAADNRDELRAKGARAANLALTQFDRSQLADQFVDWLERAV
ncbi:glycosyltransferase family 4 protein [Pseudomonas sp. 10B1]|uniref:glycosyltransferase family 4 protein n=1 Tax=unclassified Pseudomonas TaxID=196821 RepID=UPI002B235402|nr:MULTISPECIES: glycosyltransferase family 4 protein [unclassified Pseudomonas]MEA9997373.1 glycosyltransferase family 4 protein [Pseudomonas sp. AA4]MEB0089399.1 glycosyltransferase family 4 protein [Pseudomonas sp. RTI1]MEB0128553.1 glycosyltransferase family 4 protein [Pseudomonas sp. CCC1.2]MEB0155835.1 glycosyltransferase family 4 protein [Pseudomonas sp. CCC4.3]MEB0222009.1 glycosyltransferase family 4 protein [Pseudomonas sp. AB12(2023)]